MARKIGMLDVHQEDSDIPVTFIKKTVAKQLVRRLFADWVVKNHLLRKRVMRSYVSGVKAQDQLAPVARREYEHHIEPRLIRCTITNSPWERYLHGFDGRG